MSDEPNGNVLKHRVGQLEHKWRGTEQAVKFVAEKGAKANEQLRVHDEQIKTLKEGQEQLHDDLANERKEREGFNSKVLWLLVTTAFSLAAAAVAFALGVVPQ